MKLAGTKTEKNLKDAFAGESQANRRYLYFAAKADVEGYNDVSAVFRSTAEGETGHAHGHLEYLEQVGDPATGLPIGETKLNLKAAIAGETHEYSDMYPGHGEGGARRGLRRDRRLVRDARQSRALARQSLPEGARSRFDRLEPNRAREAALAERQRHAREGSLKAPHRHALNWRDPSFYDEAALERELQRVFEICHGCRRCFNLCHSFPTLFDAIDASRDDGARYGRQARLLAGGRELLPVRHVLHGEVPVRAAAPLERRFSAPDAARQGGRRSAASRRAFATACSPPPMRSGASPVFRSSPRSSTRPTAAPSMRKLLERTLQRGCERAAAALSFAQRRGGG